MYSLRSWNKSFGVLIICTEQILARDVFRFMMMYIVVTMSFAQAFYSVYSDNMSANSSFKHPGLGAFALFIRDMGGEYDIGHTYSFPDPGQDWARLRPTQDPRSQSKPRFARRMSGTCHFICFLRAKYTTFSRMMRNIARFE